MIFYRSHGAPRELSVSAVRSFSAASLLAYPAGALVLALGPRTPAVSVAGYGLILLALIFYAALVSSSVQRIVGEQVNLLDEFELRLRGRALSLAYGALTVLLLLAVMYAALASDHGGWVPSSYQAYNGVFWGVFLYASVLPTTVLSWILEPSFTQE